MIQYLWWCVMSEKSPKQLLQEKRDFCKQHVHSCQKNELTSTKNINIGIF